jgi:hypothetical protein
VALKAENAGWSNLRANTFYAVGEQGMGMSFRACILTFSGERARGRPLPTQDERLRPFLGRRG